MYLRVNKHKSLLTLKDLPLLCQILNVGMLKWLLLCNIYQFASKTNNNNKYHQINNLQRRIYQKRKDAHHCHKNQGLVMIIIIKIQQQKKQAHNIKQIWVQLVISYLNRVQNQQLVNKIVIQLKECQLTLVTLSKSMMLMNNNRQVIMTLTITTIKLLSQDQMRHLVEIDFIKQMIIIKGNIIMTKC